MLTNCTMSASFEFLPFERYAALVKMGSLPPLDRSQHIPQTHRTPQALTAQSGPSPSHQALQSSFTEPAIRCACKSDALPEGGKAGQSRNRSITKTLQAA